MSSARQKSSKTRQIQRLRSNEAIHPQYEPRFHEEVGFVQRQLMLCEALADLRQVCQLLEDALCQGFTHLAEETLSIKPGA